METKTEQTKLNYSLPIAIVLAGIIIAGAIYFRNGEKAEKTITKDTPVNIMTKIRPITLDDHIQGDPNAPIVIIEYSDTECPFCKIFQVTMQSIIKTYGKDGKVAWVYRHFPLDILHKKSRKEAEATECANELGGSVAFWKMLDTIYLETPANDGLELAKLTDFAKEAGLDTVKFNNCLSSGKYAEKVEADLQDGIKAGVTGTPASLFVLNKALSPDSKTKLDKYVSDNNIFDRNGKPLIYTLPGNKLIFTSGALPLEMMKTIISIALNN